MKAQRVGFPLLRIVFDILLVGATFFLPWWAMLVLVIGACIFFSWFLEAIIIGLYFDMFFGYRGLPWYLAVQHVGLFTVPLLIVEYIKPRVYLKNRL